MSARTGGGPNLWRASSSGLAQEIPLRSGGRTTGHLFPGLRWGLSFASLSRFRHEHGKKGERRDRDSSEKQKSGRVAEALHDESRSEIAQAGPDANARRNESLSEIETARPAH